MATLVDFNAHDSGDNKLKKSTCFQIEYFSSMLFVPSNTLINDSNIGEFSVATEKKSILNVIVLLHIIIATTEKEHSECYCFAEHYNCNNNLVFLASQDALEVMFVSD